MWKWRLGDFPGCPVGKTLCFHCRELRSQMLCIVAKKKKIWRQGMGLRCQKPRNMWGYQNLKGARKDSSLQAEKWVWSCHTSIQTSSLQNSETTHLHVSMSTHLCEFSWHFFFLSHCTTCGILVPWPGIEPVPLQQKCRVLTTGPPGKSLMILLHSNPSKLNVVCYTE